MTQRDATKTGAQQKLPPEALYLPFEAGPHRMLMGLVARHPDELIEINEVYPAEIAERRALLGGAARCSRRVPFRNRPGVRPWTASQPCCQPATSHGSHGTATGCATA